MKFLLYSHTSEATVAENLGGIDYSYYFVLRSYLPLLQRLGEVEVLTEPLTRDNRDHYRVDGDCIYFSFTPPNKVALDSGARVIPVFAWEYSTLPDETISCPEDNWAQVLESSWAAITHSSFAARVVREALGPNFPILSQPAPVWDSFVPTAARQEAPASLPALDCAVIDSADFRVDGNLLLPAGNAGHGLARVGHDWQRTSMGGSLRLDAEAPPHYGFVARESWGAWSAIANPWLILPRYVTGPVVLELELLGTPDSAGRLLAVHLGDARGVVRLGATPQSHRLLMTPTGSSNLLSFSWPGAVDSRALPQLGLVAFSLESAPGMAAAELADVLAQPWPGTGFHEPEAWGSWTGDSCCTLVLPQSVAGNVLLRFTIANAVLPAGTSIEVQLGDRSVMVDYQAPGQQVAISFLELDSSDHFALLAPVASVGGADARVLGLGISDLDILRAPHFLPGQSVDLITDNAVTLVGFHALESWGRWIGQQQCQLELPFVVCGTVQLRLEILNNPHSQDGVLELQLGGSVAQLVLAGGAASLVADFHDVAPTTSLSLHGVVAKPLADSGDPRDLGLGLAAMVLSMSDSGPPPARPPEQAIASVPVVYTAVLNPTDRRKNWLDLVNGFVFALRDQPQAVLLVKLTHADVQRVLADLVSFFVDLAPFRCRLVFLHGYLSTADYRALIADSSYVVNTSRGEGQCLPLMEFMSAGVPAIAPAHTAMADYIRPQNALVLAATEEPTFWPHDPRMLYRTMRYRINWESVRDAFQRSFELALAEPRTYAAMSADAIEALRDYCALEPAVTRLDAFLQALPREE